MYYSFSIYIVSLCSINFCYGQNLFFVGKRSYPCTETFTLKSDMDSSGPDLDVLIAKTPETAMIVASTKVSGGGVRIKGTILIYLDDGTVISCIDRDKFDYVNNEVTTIYYLTDAEIDKIKDSNIHTIRFSLKCFECLMSSEEGNFSASNKASDSLFSKKQRTNVSALIEDLFE